MRATLVSPAPRSLAGPTPSRPCLVLIPGTLCDERLFRKQSRTLRGVARVVVPDYTKLTDRRQWSESLMAQLPARFSVAGFSLGGMFALELLRLAPERIERMALIASNAQPGSDKIRRRSANLRRLWQSRGPAHVVEVLQRRYFHHEAVRRQHASLLRRMAVDTPSRTAAEQFQWAAQRPAGYDALKLFQRPLLIVSGAQDRVCPHALQRAMHEAQPQARWIEFARCGHLVPLEAASHLSRVLARWMREPVSTIQGVST